MRAATPRAECIHCACCQWCFAWLLLLCLALPPCSHTLIDLDLTAWFVFPPASWLTSGVCVCVRVLCLLPCPRIPPNPDYWGPVMGVPGRALYVQFSNGEVSVHPHAHEGILHLAPSPDGGCTTSHAPGSYKLHGGMSAAWWHVAVCGPSVLLNGGHCALFADGRQLAEQCLPCVPCSASCVAHLLHPWTRM